MHGTERLMEKNGQRYGVGFHKIMDTWNGKSIQSNRGKVQDGWGSMRLQTYAMTKTVKIIKETWLKVWDGLLWAELWEKLSKVMEEKVGQK